jgi:hypothetical protein
MINRTGDNIAEQWQSELDLGLETGAPPLLNLGNSRSGLDALPALLAFHHLEDARKDMAPPSAAAGGVSPYWLLALLHARGPATPPRSHGSVTAFSGPDPATHAAALGVLELRRANSWRRRGELPPPFQPTFRPHVQAGAQPWDTLPFAQSQPNEAVHRDGWTAWIAVVAALVLMLIAIVA